MVILCNFTDGFFDFPPYYFGAPHITFGTKLRLCTQAARILLVQGDHSRALLRPLLRLGSLNCCPLAGSDGSAMGDAGGADRAAHDRVRRPRDAAAAAGPPRQGGDRPARDLCRRGRASRDKLDDEAAGRHVLPAAAVQARRRG